jgi:hypothetical protein
MKTILMLLIPFYFSLLHYPSSPMPFVGERLHNFGKIPFTTKLNHTFVFECKSTEEINISEIIFENVYIDTPPIKYTFELKYKDSIKFQTPIFLNSESKLPILNDGDSVRFNIEYKSNGTGYFHQNIVLKTQVRDVYFIIEGDLIESFEDQVKNACQSIQLNTDLITKEKQYSSPVFENPTVLKYVKNNVSTYYLSLTAKGSTLNVNEKGVVILFTDDSKLIKSNEKINVDVNSDASGWEYSAFIRLLPSDLALLSKKKIQMFRLYIYDTKVDTNHSEMLPLYVNCLKNLK